MVGTRAAIRYAKAILEVAQSKNVANEVSADMNQIETTIANNLELNTFIQNPTITSDVKDAVLREVFAGSNDTTFSLFQLLTENKRFEILAVIALEYQKLMDELNNVEVAEVTTALPLDTAMEAKVLEKIKEFTTKTITIKNIVDETIIGGFILRIGDKQFNASVANRLKVLKRELSN